MTLSKSAAQFLANDGWSARRFVPHFRHLLENFDGDVEVGQDRSSLASRWLRR